MAGPRLELTWPHKDEFLLVPKDDDGKPVWVPREHPAANEVRLTSFVEEVGDVNAADPHLDNTVFVGDSFDAMRVMGEVPEFAARYLGKVKLIYADPPFNTGQTFTHYDDWMEHATWLSFMRERLLLMKDLLSPDGSVWVHLDDAEVHRMRCLLDEIFGANNFVATVLWKRRNDPRNTARHISADHDYVLVYARDITRCVFSQLDRSEGMDAAYTNPDKDRRGPWRRGDLAARNYYSKGLYAVTTPGGALISGPPSGSYWRVSQEELTRLDADGRIYWGTDGMSRPYLKRFLSEVSAGRVPSSVWHPEEVGFVRNGKEEVRALVGDVFATPKPEKFVERILHIGTSEGDLVFDPFAGSGTTAAVAHKMGRRWATSELSISNVDEFIRPRLTKVIDGEDRGGITESTGWTGGGGFRTVLVEPSLYEVGPDAIVLLREDVNREDLERAMCGQMRFTYTPNNSPFCGQRGRMLLAVVPGAIGTEELDDLLAQLPDNTRLTVAAGVILHGAADYLTKCSRGSRALKIPRDVLTRTLRSTSDTQPREING